MVRVIQIYGKEGCPYTRAARNEYAKRGYLVKYFDVRKDEKRLKELLEYSKGLRKVPVLVESGQVTIGFGGT